MKPIPSTRSASRGKPKRTNPRDRPPHLRLEHWAQIAPGAPALEQAGRTLDYDELAARVSDLSASLSAHGVGRDTPVGLLAGRSVELIIGVLAVLDAGGACLPIDPKQPLARTRLILRDARSPLVLVDSAGRDYLQGIDIVTLRLDLDTAPPGRQRPPLNAFVGLDALAYVVYTSGSTGSPKGVAVTHRTLANLIDWQARRFFVPAARTLQFAPLGFDVAFQEILSTFASGGTLVIPSDEQRNDLIRLGRALEELGIERLFVPPLALHHIAEGCRVSGVYPRRLREVIVAGEQLRITPAIASLFEAIGDCYLENQYGPSETHVVTAHRLEGRPEAWPTLPPIGQPIDNVRIDLVDPRLRPVPDGTVGEICAAGPCVARGYINATDTGAGRFLDNPFGTDPPERVYRTGDLGRRRPDGQIEFLRRSDDQVKILGYRVELGEVEAALLRHPKVTNAAVALKTRAGEQRVLVAYFVAAGPLDAASVRAFLEEMLPSYMVPKAFVEVEDIPLTRNGKTDRDALPSPAAPTGEPSQPRTSLEAALLAAWAEALQNPSVGTDDNLLELGADSLAAMRAAARVQELAGVRLPLHAVFADPTVAALARSISKSETTASRGLVPTHDRDGPPRLSFAQERLWFLEHYRPRTTVFTVATRYRLVGDVNVTALRRALEDLLRRHEALRTRFGQHDGQPVQRVGEARIRLARCDVSSAEARDRVRKADEAVHAFLAKPWNLERDRLMRTMLVTLDERRHWLVVSMHHAIVDGWSLDIILNDLAELYDARARGMKPSGWAGASRYADIAEWQRRRLAQGELDDQLAYWVRALEGAPVTLDLPFDRPRPELGRGRGAVVEARFASPLVDRLRFVSRSRHATLFVAVLAGLGELVHSYTGAEDVTIGSVVANRARPECRDVVGLLANLVPLRIDLSGDPSFAELIDRLRRVWVGALDNQDVPFDRIVAAINPDRDPSVHPLCQVVVSYEHTPVTQRRGGGVRFTADALHAGGAQFDLLLSVSETRRGAKLSVEYDRDLFDRETIRGMLDRLETLLDRSAANPHERLSARVAASTGGEDAERLVAGANPADSGPAPTAHTKPPLVRPRNDYERAIADIWGDVLGADDVGALDDFFVLGGDSLTAMQVVLRLRQAFECDVALQAIFTERTVARLAAVIADHSASS